MPETAGYTGVRNDVYRIQVHEGNFAPTATGFDPSATPDFKWSRDNASTIGAWREHPSTLEIGVDSHDRLYRNPFLDPLKPHELKADIATPLEDPT